MNQSDVIIIGGGIIGLSIAYELGQLGIESALVESNSIGTGATNKAGGMLAPLCEYLQHPNEKMLRLSLESHSLYKQFSQSWGEDFLWERGGFLRIHRKNEDVDYLLSFVKQYQSELPFDTRVIDKAELYRLLPRLKTGFDGALHTQESWLHPASYVRALQRQIRHCSMHEGQTITRIEEEQGGFCVETERQQFVAKKVVIAAGAWSTQVASMMGFSIEVFPVRGQMLVFQPKKELTEHVLRWDGTYIIPQGHFGLYVGASEEDVGFSSENTELSQAQLHQQASQVFEELRTLKPVQTWHGFRPTTPSLLPVIKSFESGVYIASGHYRNGILLAPITGKIVANSIFSGEDIDIFPS